MPSLERIAGQPVINLSIEEEFERRIGGGSLDLSGLTAPNSYNEFPVITVDGRYVQSTGGVFSDRELAVALATGHIVCDPAPSADHGARINGSSIDVTLGHYFYTAGKHHERGLYNPFSEADTLRYFDVQDPETDYKMAKPWGEVKEKLGAKALARMGDLEHLEGFPDSHPMILLRPNERILTHTNEFIGILPPGTTSMQARSTTGRIGLSACYCAGWGDPGYINRWTMEVHNLNENEHLPIPVGFRIAQVVFNATGPVGTEYSKATGSYQKQDSTDVRAIKKAWRPHFVLPKAYNNEIVLPDVPEGMSEGLK